MAGAGKLDRFSTTLLDIYRAARELPADQFQDRVLQLLKPLIGFDSSMWGSGTWRAPGVDVHSIHLFEQPAEMITEWMRVNSEDTIAHAVVRTPGWVMNAHMPTLFSSKRKRAMRDYTTRFDKGSGLVTRYHHTGAQTDSSLISWISLYRKSPDRHFTERDRADFEAIVPHIVEALTINRLVHLDRMFTREARRTAQLAIVDRRGRIHTAEAGFAPLLRGEWSAWEGEALPLPLMLELGSGHDTFLGERILVGARSVGDLLFLHARPLTGFDRLTPRQRDVARHFAAGQNYKGVARGLGISPTTARNHLQAIYAKLRINDRVALAKLIAADD